MKKTHFFFIFIFFTNLIFPQKGKDFKTISDSYNHEKINDLKERLIKLNIDREKRILFFLKGQNKKTLRRYNKDNRIFEIFDIVNNKPIYRATNNIKSASATKTNKLHLNGGLGLNIEGQNMVVGVWDSESVLASHEEFKNPESPNSASRITFPEFPNGILIGAVSDHATHVAGTLIAAGIDSDAKGMAPKATIRSFDWSDDNIEALNEASNGLLISNHSYGFPVFNSNQIQQRDSKDIGSYTSTAKTWDEIAYTAPYYLAVIAAGNEGRLNYNDAISSGYDKLTSFATSKNNLVVANANPSVFGNTLINFTINASSSQGPTDDFRIKPDISGDGSLVYSTVSKIPSGSSKLYDTYSGTSMASPNVAGSLLLLQQYYNELNSKFMKSSTLKALVCHTAKDNVSKIGPDPIFGWGLLDIEEATNVIKNEYDGNSLIEETKLQEGNIYTYNFSVSTGTPIKVTICWTDPAGNVNNSEINSLTPALINDLDLTVKHTASNTIFYPWKLDNTNVTNPALKGVNNVDNIERVDIKSPEAGNYTISISNKNSLLEGFQYFSLIITGESITLKNPVIEKENTTIWNNYLEKKLFIKNAFPDKNSEISIFNILGNKIFNKKINNPTSSTYSINTSDFASGIYIISVKNDNVITNKKILIN